MDGRTSVLCNVEKCILNDGEGGCTKGCITISEDNQCEDCEGK